LSSILRALKKLDEEAMSRESQPGEPKIKMSRMVNRGAKTSRVINRSLSISLVLLLLVIAGWMIINSNLKPPVPEKQGNSPKRQLLTKKPAQAPLVKRESPKESIPPAITTEPSKPLIGPEFSVLEKETKHPEFILNGILWSHIPGRRVALINNRYFKEGDKIKGVSVIQIREKAVTLQAGEEKWTIRLKK
jgi:hypothetical protein